MRVGRQLLAERGPHRRHSLFRHLAQGSAAVEMLADGGRTWEVAAPLLDEGARAPIRVAVRSQQPGRQRLLQTVQGSVVV